MITTDADPGARYVEKLTDNVAASGIAGKVLEGI